VVCVILEYHHLLTIFMLASDSLILPASDMSLRAFGQARLISDSKVVGPETGLTNRVYRGVRLLACFIPTGLAPVAIFRRELVPGQMC